MFHFKKEIDYLFWVSFSTAKNFKPIFLEKPRLILIDKTFLFKAKRSFFLKNHNSSSNQFHMNKSTFISIFGLVRIISYLDIGRRLIFYWHLTFNKRLNHYSRSSRCERIIGNFSRTLYIWKTMRINIEIAFVCFFTLDFLYHIYTCVLFGIQI